MALVTCSECGKEFSEKAAACPHCGCPIEEAIKKPTTVIENKSNANDLRRVKTLRDYLEQVRLLETDIYTMDEAIARLTAQIKPEAKRNTITPPSEPGKLETDNVLVAGIGGFIGALTDPLSVGEFLLSPLVGVETAIHQGVTNRKHRKENEKRTKTYEIAILSHEAAVREEDARYEKECAQNMLFNSGVDRQVEILRSEKAAVEAALQRLYELDVVYPKYRALIPITQFCEYMDSGRRTELGGVHGMYDLYETDLLGQRIVDKLSDINRTLRYISYQIGGIAQQLTGIQRNQTMLYEEVARGNEIAKEICQNTKAQFEQSAAMVSKMDGIKHEMSQLKTTAEVVALSTATTARRVDALAKIGEYEFALKHPAFPNV